MYFQTRDFFRNHHPFMAGFMGKPRRTGDVANGIQARHSRFTILVRYNVGSINFYTKSLKTEAFNITNDPDR